MVQILQTEVPEPYPPLNGEQHIRGARGLSIHPLHIKTIISVQNKTNSLPNSDRARINALVEILHS